jgi:prolyl 4-hydroxylase
MTTATFEFQQLSVSPSIWLVERFLSEQECLHLIEVVKQILRPATVIDPFTGKSIQNEARTNSFAFLKPGQDEMVREIESRIGRLLDIPVENGEAFQILHYEQGQQYVPHFDFFRPERPGGPQELLRGGQRVATVLLYLNDTEEGGETNFPRLGLSVPPKRGNALIFYNVFDDGQPDFDTEHASLPVIKGEKWLATKWLRERAYC